MARAEAAGAVDAVAVDAKEEFAEHHCLPALMANALYEDKYPLVDAIGAAAHRQASWSRRPTGTVPQAVAHGCTGKGNDQVRVDIGVRALDPGLEIVAPPGRRLGRAARSCSTTCAAHDIPVNLTKKSPYSIDENLWDAATNAACSKTPGWRRPRTPFSSSSRSPTRPTSPSIVVVSFERVSRWRSTASAMGMVELIETIDAIGNTHGFGRVDMIENRLVGIKSREVYEVAGSLA